MARIRTVKPEFWSSEQITKCSRDARLLFVGMWNFCDDAGIHTANCHRIRLEVFPDDGLSNETVAAWMKELIDGELVKEYEVAGQRYWLVMGWKHQKIESPTYKFPLPSGEIPHSSKTSPNSRRRVGDKSANDCGDRDDVSPPEGKGMEEELDKDGKEKDCVEPGSAATPPAPPDPVFATFPTTGREGDPTIFRVHESLILEFSQAYPAVNVRGEVRKAYQWILANPGRKKTAKGMRSFLNNWMAREQNRGGGRDGPQGGNYGRPQQPNPSHAKRHDDHKPRQFVSASQSAPAGGEGRGGGQNS